MAQTFYTEKWADDYDLNKAAKKGVLNLTGKVLTAPVAGLWAMLKDSAGVAPSGGGGGASFGTPQLKEINTDVVKDDYKKSYGGTGGGGYGSTTYGGGGMVDLTNILAAYEKEAASNRNIAKQTYETARNDLLTSLKRFQEQNAKDVQNQQRSYLSNQASLESAIAQADRQNRISAAARGLGGSGLQQLAQLQNLLSQGQTISNMATQNQGAMDNLRTLLRNKQEDTDTRVANALTTYNNAISSINSALAANKANKEYEARERAEDRKLSYASLNASAGRAAAADAKAEEQVASGLSQDIASQQETLTSILRKIANLSGKKLANYVNPYTGEKLGTKDKEEAKRQLYEDARATARSLLSGYKINTNTDTSKTFLQNLLDIYNN